MSPTELNLMAIARSAEGGAWSAVDRAFIDKLVMFAREVLRLYGDRPRDLTKDEVRAIYTQWRHHDESTMALYWRIKKAENSPAPSVKADGDA